MEGALGDPKEEDQDEDPDGLPLFHGHLAHGGEFTPQAVDAALNLRHLLLLLHGEEHIHAQQEAYDEDDQAHRPHGDEPLLVAEVAGAQETGDEGNGEEVRSTAGIEGIGPDIHLEQVLDHEVAAEVVPVPARGAIDGADDHEDREHDGRLHRRRGNEGGKDEVDEEETPQHTLRTLAELDDEGEGQPLGELRLHQHRGEHEAQDVEPHHRVAQLREGFLLRGHVEKDHEQDQDERGQVVRERLRNPEDEARDEDAQHRVIGPDESVQAQGIQPFLGRSGQRRGIQVVDEPDVAEPTDPDKGGDRERTAQPGHPHLELRLLHLGQFLDFVIAHVQRVEHRRLCLRICRHNEVTSSSCKGSS